MKINLKQYFISTTQGNVFGSLIADACSQVDKSNFEALDKNTKVLRALVKELFPKYYQKIEKYKVLGIPTSEYYFQLVKIIEEKKLLDEGFESIFTGYYIQNIGTWRKFSILLLHEAKSLLYKSQGTATASVLQEIVVAVISLYVLAGYTVGYCFESNTYLIVPHIKALNEEFGIDELSMLRKTLRSSDRTNQKTLLLCDLSLTMGLDVRRQTIKRLHDMGMFNVVFHYA